MDAYGAGSPGSGLPPVVVVAGVSGTGKTRIGSLLAQRLGWRFDDGDDLHPAANIAKMRAGFPLTDADRGPWLAVVAARIDEHIAAGEPAVVACSALKRSYRDFLRQGRPSVRVVFLRATPATLADRLASRPGHFFPPQLLRSQLADEEPPQEEEGCLVVDVEATPDQVTDGIIRQLGLTAPSHRADTP
ncbi:MAG TPA: gluconokinase [Streptosporangiaceae bacterium]|nr:gluconokinase [Streptosporangiaceae bacterium]